MKAICVQEFGGPDVLTMQEMPDPQAQPGQVLVRLRAVGVNPVETYQRAGASGPRPFPWTPGTDGAGVVEAVGAGVQGWAPGNRVYLCGSLTGTYAELTVCLPEHLQPLPDKLTFAQGAALFVPYTTAYRALFLRGQARPGEWVLIHGASGGVGLAALQFGQAWGLRLIGTAGDASGCQPIRENGAQLALDHHDPDLPEKIANATEGLGPSLILEMLANVNLQKDLEMVARFGRVVVIGNRGTLDFNPRGVMQKEADIRGLMLFNSNPEDTRQAHQAIGAGLRAGYLKPLVGQQFPLEQASQAHVAVLARGSHGKIILVPGPAE